MPLAKLGVVISLTLVVSKVRLSAVPTILLLIFMLIVLPEDYMNGFKCNVSSSTSNVALAQPQVPRRCGADPDFQKLAAIPSNCTFGAKQPFYWFQIERNNVRVFMVNFSYFGRITLHFRISCRCLKDRSPRPSIRISTTSATARRMTYS